MTTHALAAGYGGAYAASITDSEQNQAWVVPVAAVALTGVAVLGVAAVVSAVGASSSSGHRVGGRCYQSAVERLFEDRLTYTEEELQKSLLELTIRKFQQEGSSSHSRPLQPGLPPSEVEPAARKSMLKALRNGLTPRKMERFLNEHVRRLREISPPSLRASLRDFDRHETKCQDLSQIEAPALFRRGEVRRYIVLSFQKVDRMQKGAPAHFDAILHSGRAWFLAKRSPKFLVEGEATAEDAKRALDEFAKRKYGGLSRNGVHTIFSERA